MPTLPTTSDGSATVGRQPTGRPVLARLFLRRWDGCGGGRRACSLAGSFRRYPRPGTRARRKTAVRRYGSIGSRTAPSSREANACARCGPSVSSQVAKAGWLSRSRTSSRARVTPTSTRRSWVWTAVRPSPAGSPRRRAHRWDGRPRPMSLLPVLGSPGRWPSRVSRAGPAWPRTGPGRSRPPGLAVSHRTRRRRGTPRAAAR